jgi:hypothetical protein
MTADSAHDFLTKNRIKYILFTKYEGDRRAFETHYPFLKQIFSNTDATVYMYE